MQQPLPDAEANAHVTWRQVYGVHCGGSPSSQPFYQAVASTTGGQYLPLDSLQTMTDTFAALCLREVIPPLPRRCQCAVV